MYEELVALLRKKYDKAPMVMEAADAIAELSKQIKAVQCVNIGDLDCDSSQLCTCMGIVRKRLEADAKKPRWIPVTEKNHPKANEPVMVVYTGWNDALPHRDCTAYWSEDEGLWRWAETDGKIKVPVTHYMPLPPLPEPPKEES